MSLQYLKDAVAAGDAEKLIRYVRLHLGDGNEDAGRREIDKAWVQAVPLAPLRKPLSECRVAFISTSGVQPRASVPFDTVHPVGDYTFRRVPSSSRVDELEIHQLKYPTAGAHRDLNVIFPIERLRELADEGMIGALTDNFFTFIGYNMDPERLERTLAEEIANAVSAEGADIALAAPA